MSGDKSSKRKAGRPPGLHCLDHILNSAQVRQLYKECRDEYDTFFLVCCVEFGMRESEIAAMRESWLDYEQRAIRIPLHDDGWEAKTKAAARPIPAYDMSARGWEEVVAFFKTRIRCDRKVKTIYRRIRDMGRRANIYTFPHALRATCATNMVDLIGDRPYSLRDMFGWKNLASASPYVKQSLTRLQQTIRDGRRRSRQ